MANSGVRVDEIRFVIRPHFTDVYVACAALGDSPIGVQGWHHKTFPKNVPVDEILQKHFTDFVLWDLGAPADYGLPDSIKEALNSGDGTYRP